MATLCGGPHQLTAAPGDINNALLDVFSLAHAGVGLGLGFLRLGLGATLAIALGWEVAEHLLKDCIPGAFIFPTQDTVVNAGGDVLATALGWRVGQPLRAGLSQRFKRDDGTERWRPRRPALPPLP